jgi:hypothetical protein
VVEGAVGGGVVVDDDLVRETLACGGIERRQRSIQRSLFQVTMRMERSSARARVSTAGACSRSYIRSAIA